MRTKRAHKRIIFLDVDGVLNSEYYWDHGSQVGPRYYYRMDRRAVKRVAEIVKRTGAKIVISSMWRFSFSLNELRHILYRLGLPQGSIVGATPLIHSSRGREINLWLLKHPTEEFVILDDDTDMAPLKHRHVVTTFERGLEDHHVEKAVALFEEKADKNADKNAA